VIGEAARHAEAKRSADAIVAYRQALAASRDRDQVDLVANGCGAWGRKWTWPVSSDTWSVGN